MDSKAISILDSSADDVPRVVDLRRRLEEAHSDLRIKLRLWAECKRRTEMQFSQEMEEATEKMSLKRQALYEKNLDLSKVWLGEGFETKGEIAHRQMLAEKEDSVELEEAERRTINLAYELSLEREARFGGFGYKWVESLLLF